MPGRLNGSRRSFLKSGAMVGLPLAAVSAPALALTGDDNSRTLVRLEAERAIGKLQREFMRMAGQGQVSTLAERVAALRPVSDMAEPEIDLSECGRFADVRQHCLAITNDEPEDCTLVQMARLQGNSFSPCEQRRIVEASYADVAGQGWTLMKVALA